MKNNRLAPSSPPVARQCVEPRHVAMLFHGRESYGIGTILKLYADAWPQTTFVSLSEGPMVEWLKSHGHQVEVIAGLAHFRASPSSLATLLRIPSTLATARRTAARLHERLRDKQIQIVHTHRLPQQLAAGFLRRYGYRSVWQINNNMDRGRLGGLGVKLNHRLARWGADLLLPASDFIAENWSGSGVPMHTIHNAASPIYASPNQLELPPIRCVIAGRLVASKGHHLAVDAVIAARQAGLDVRLDVFGGPREENHYAHTLMQKCEAAGMHDAIRWMGFCDDLRQRHQQYHLGLQCRIDPEPCSLWVCETLVDGLPLIASASGGTPELVKEGETGLLFTSGDTGELSAKLIELAKDPVRLGGMRQAAFERGQRHFTTDRLGHNTLAAYKLLGL